MELKHQSELDNAGEQQQASQANITDLETTISEQTE
jgi:hypothetical protein